MVREDEPDRKRASGDRPKGGGGKGGGGGKRGSGDRSKGGEGGDDGGEWKPLEIRTHRQLMGRQRDIFRRMEARPELGAMFFINPVLALKDLGVSLTPELRDHVLRSLRHPPRVDERRRELEARLEEALGETPRPEDPAWLATTLFRTLKVKPLRTRGHAPAYRSSLPEGALERLSALRPELRRRTHRPRGRAGGTRIVVQEWEDRFRRLDLDAPVPRLPRAGRAPKTMSLGTLFFYKDRHPLARDLLELGLILERGLPFHRPGGYRDIRDGRKPNAFRRWIRSVRFPAGEGR